MFRKPGKQALYERALKAVTELDDDNLRGSFAPGGILFTSLVATLDDGTLPEADRREAVAKALRVERGRRR